MTLLGGAAAAWPLATRAQQPAKIALASRLDNPITAEGYQVLVTELRKLGSTERENLAIEHRRIDEGAFKGLCYRCLASSKPAS